MRLWNMALKDKCDAHAHILSWKQYVADRQFRLSLSCQAAEPHIFDFQPLPFVSVDRGDPFRVLLRRAVNEFTTRMQQDSDADKLGGDSSP